MTFSSKFGMQRHLVTHSETKKYQCPICERKFALQNYLKDHLNIHTGQNPYQCKVPGCGASFKQASSFSNHKKKHKMLQSQVCTELNKREAKAALKKETQLHTIIKPQPPIAQQPKV
jgi:hypothetical protein